MFKDQNEIASYAVDAVKWAAEKGFVKGDDKGYFHPTDPVTRQDLCVILKRVYEDLKQGTGTTPTNPPVPPTQPEKPPVTPPPTPTKQPKTDQEIEKLAKDVSVYVDLATNGTAVLLKNGYVLTAKHVSKGKSLIGLKTRTGQRLQAFLVSDHPNTDTDISLYRVEADPSSLPYVPITSDPIKSGEKVVTVQANYLDQVYRTGQICRLATSDKDWEFDASLAAEHGNSGGAVINQYGELIGIVVQRTSVGVQNGSLREVVPGCEAVNLTHAHIRNWLQPYGVL